MAATAVRRLLPERRHSWTQKAKVGGRTIYVTCGEYDDGSLGEIFIDYPHASIPMRAVMSLFAMAFSIDLQYGVPLGALLHGLRLQNFLPEGMVEGCPEVQQALSLIDYVRKLLQGAYPDQAAVREKSELTQPPDEPVSSVAQGGVADGRGAAPPEKVAGTSLPAEDWPEGKPPWLHTNEEPDQG